MTFLITGLFRSAERLIVRFLGFTSKERYLLIEAFILLWTVRLGLWVFSFRNVESLSSINFVWNNDENISDEKIIWAITATNRFVPRATCLIQAISARVLLSMHGYSSEFRLGVAHEGDHLVAHAWLEKEGRVLIGGPISNFRLLPVERP